MAFIPLPKIYHPDFVSPRLKPKGGIELNPAHTLRKGLVLDIEMNQGSGQAVDLVSGRLLTNAGHGWGIDADGNRETTYSASTDDSIQLTGLSNFSGNAHTVHIRARISAFDDSGMVIFSWSNNGTHFWQVDDTLTTVFVGGSSLNTTTADHEGATNNLRDWLFISDPDTNTTYFYENGVLLNTLNSTVTLPTGSKDIFIGRFSGGATFSLDGGITFCRAWNRAITDAERVQLFNSNYTHLEPVNKPIYFTVSAVIAGGDLLLTNRSIANFQGMRQ